MSNTTRPYIVLIPGAWHSADSYDLLVPYLRDSGYDVTAIDLPSVGAEPPIQSLQPEIDRIRGVILPLLDRGKNVIVVMHSYAGVAGSSALFGLSRNDRLAANLPGGVTALVYLCAWMVPEGASVRSAGGGQGGKGGSKRVRQDVSTETFGCHNLLTGVAGRLHLSFRSHTCILP